MTIDNALYLNCSFEDFFWHTIRAASNENRQKKIILMARFRDLIITLGMIFRSTWSGKLSNHARYLLNLIKNTESGFLVRFCYFNFFLSFKIIFPLLFL